MESKPEPEDLGRPYDGNALWFWQSDPDPFKEKDSSKWNWEPYPDESCCIIEEAFSLKKPMADLGNYEINFKKMMQVNKKDAYKMRRVKREVNNHIENRMSVELPMPSFIDKEQKTFSAAFGNVHHFLDYLMKRTAETFRIFKKLKELTLDSKMVEFDDIIQEVINSIQQAAEMRVSMVNARVVRKSDPLTESKRVIEKIKANSQNLRGFLQTILQIYTMESFVCYFLNELLRNEDWGGLNILIPYLTCLTYTFQLQDYIIQQEPNKGVKESLLSFFNMKTLVVYRGAALTEEHLACYDVQKYKYFSWNSVTSTSRDKKVALSFVRNSMKNPQEKKRGVIFIIETDFSLVEDCEGMIDVSIISEYKTEKEIILVPGTVFKIKSKNLNNENIYEIRLEIKKKFKNNEKGLSLLGSLQKKVISKDGALFDGLAEDEIIRSVQLLAGNKLINKLEVKNCVIDGHLTEMIGNMIMSTKLKSENVKIFQNKILVDSLNPICFFFSDNLDSILFSNEIVYIKNIKKREVMEANWRIKKLSLEEKTLRKLLANQQIKELLDRIMTEKELVEIKLAISNIFSEDELNEIGEIVKNQRSLKRLSLDFMNTKEESRLRLEKFLQSTRNLQSLSLNFSHSDLSEKELKELRDMIMDMTLIQHLSLDFESCKRVTEDGWSYFVGGLERLKKLTHLSINFKNCGNFTDHGLIIMSETLSKLTALTSLSLDFEWYENITDNALTRLSDSLTLTNLSLDFRWYFKITDDGLIRQSDSLAKLPTLTNLSLDFRLCKYITNNKFTRLSDSLATLPTLTNLSLNLEKCMYMTDDEFIRLSDSLAKLTTLTNLLLHFRGCEKFTNNGLIRLSDSLAKLTALTNLSLNLKRCEEITDNGLTKLSDSLAKLTTLTNLSLYLKIDPSQFRYEHITDNGFTRISDSLVKLPALTNLLLHFRWCSDITDNGFARLSDNLTKLTTLTILSLNFERCFNDNRLTRLSDSLAKLTALTNISLNFRGSIMIIDNGFIRLSDSLEKLTILTNLSLDFKECHQITDNGLTRLSDSLAKSTTLTNLSLNFGHCEKITDNGLTKLSDRLQKLPTLTNLLLNFGWCEKITDNGLTRLSDRMQKLPIMTNLSLNFEWCEKITDNGLTRLSDRLQQLPTLTNLLLNFGWCKTITDNGLTRLSDSLVKLTTLTNLSLDFESCTEITDNGLTRLSDSLANLTTLTNLSLDFAGRGITDNGLTRLSDSLTKFTTLTDLSLDFNLHGITDNGLTRPSDSLAKLTTLTNLSLNFRWCEDITNNGLIRLSDSLAKLTTLTNLSLDFQACSGVTDNGLTRLRDSLAKQIPYLYVIKSKSSI